MRDWGQMTKAPKPRESFDNVADVYHQIRPRYPRALFEDLFNLLPTRPLVLEVGPGTGQATRDLLAYHAIVEAVEIGPGMAAKLHEVLPSPDLSIVVSDFEHVPSGRARFDAIFSATAYHWISPRAQLDRPAQLLKPGGLVAIVDLIQVDSFSDRGFFEAAQPIYERYGEGRTGPPAPIRRDVDPPMREALDRDRRYSSATVRRYDWDQTYTAAEYRKLMVSYSGTQMMEPAARTKLLDDMESFIRERFKDRVTRPLVVTLTTATAGPAPSA
jgi:SAM-dependent methyltransferase